MARCPSVERLQLLLADDPSGPEVAVLTSHVEHCSRCQQQLEELTCAANRAADGSVPERSTERTDDYEPNAGFMAQLRQSYSLVNALPPETEEGQETPCLGVR